MNKTVLVIFIILVLAGVILGWSRIRERIMPTQKETPITFITPVPQITQTVFPSITPTPRPSSVTPSPTTKGGLKNTPTTGVNFLFPSLLSLTLGLSGFYLLRYKH